MRRAIGAVAGSSHPSPALAPVVRRERRGVPAVGRVVEDLADRREVPRRAARRRRDPLGGEFGGDLAERRAGDGAGEDAAGDRRGGGILLEAGARRVGVAVPVGRARRSRQLAGGDAGELAARGALADLLVLEFGGERARLQQELPGRRSLELERGEVERHAGALAVVLQDRGVDLVARKAIGIVADERAERAARHRLAGAGEGGTLG